MGTLFVLKDNFDAHAADSILISIYNNYLTLGTEHNLKDHV